MSLNLLKSTSTIIISPLPLYVEIPGQFPNYATKYQQPGEKLFQTQILLIVQWTEITKVNIYYKA